MTEPEEDQLFDPRGSPAGAVLLGILISAVVTALATILALRLGEGFFLFLFLPWLAFGGRRTARRPFAQGVVEGLIVGGVLSLLVLLVGVAWWIARG